MGIDLTANDTTKAMRLLRLVVGWTQRGRFGRITSVCQFLKKSKIAVVGCRGWFLLLLFFPTKFDALGIDLTANDTTKVIRLLEILLGWSQLGRFGRIASVCQIPKYSKITVTECCGWFLLLFLFPTKFDALGIDLTANDTTKVIRLLEILLGWSQ